MTTLHLRKSSGRSPLRLGLFFISLALAWFALSPTGRGEDGAVGPAKNGNTAEGTNALNSLTGKASGTNNTAMGFYALFSNTNGNENTASGVNALFRNTMGSQNTASGLNALTGNTTGTGNTASGFDALVSNTTGSYNTATGYQALYSSNTDNGVNTATGFQALYSNTTGSNCTAVGFQALFSHTTGFSNTALGHQALYSYSDNSSTALGNTAVGGGALFGLTTGESNTAVGGASLQNGDTMNFNTALGRRALFRTHGDQNIGLGFFAGSNLNGGANNIFIGNVGPVPIGAESNTIRIGTQIAATATTQIPPAGQIYTIPAHTAIYIAGINGVDASAGAPVYILSTGQLGTGPAAVAASSTSPSVTVPVRFKEEMKAMKATIAKQQKQIEALTTGLQKVSDQLELSKPAPQTVSNNQ